MHASEHSGMDELFKVANEYVERVRENNAMVLEVLRDNYAYADTDDADVFVAFAEDYTRLGTEVKPEGGVRLPLSVHRRLGDISFMRPQFIERVHTKFVSKQKRLRQLGG